MIDQGSLREEHFLYEMHFDASDLCSDWECGCVYVCTYQVW